MFHLVYAQLPGAVIVPSSLALSENAVRVLLAVQRAVALV